MNLQKLFEAQRELDERIIKEKGLEGQDLLPNKILALQVELGELANEWRGFKHWSNDREPRTGICSMCNGSKYDFIEFDEPCRYCNGTGQGRKNPLLEEYVDCLHFVLSIGLDLGHQIHFCHDPIEYINFTKDDIIKEFFGVYRKVVHLVGDTSALNYWHLTNCFVTLGQMLGFTWEQIEQAYFEKNKINHERQVTGY